MKFKVKVLSVVVVSLMGHAASVDLSADEASFDLDEDIVLRYAYSNWCGRTRMTYPRLVQDWYLPDLALPTNGINAVVENEAFETGRGFFIVRNGDELIYVDSEICGSVEGAHEAVIEKFSNMTTTRIFPQVTNDIGDVLFYYQYPGDGDSVVFTRNNVFVRIRSDMLSCSATNIAKQIDVSILRASGVEP